MEFHSLYRKYKNRERYREILQTLSRHGFSFLLQRKGIRSITYWKQRVLPKYPKPALTHGLAKQITLPQRVRLLFEELGPSFVKLGQMLSTRPDLIPKEYADELGELQDGVRSFSSAEVRNQIIKAWGEPPEKIFQSFIYLPVASASIAQVHRAVLPDGHEVAVKIRRPNLNKLVEKDLAVFGDLENLLQRSVLGQVCDVGEIYKIFSRQIRREMDFTVEALNMERFSDLFDEENIVVPKVHWDYTTEHILTMDWLEGEPLKSVINKYEGSQEGQRIGELILKTVLLPAFRQGIFHGDPHPGNIFILDHSKLGLVDFGITGRLNEEFRFTVAELMIGIRERDTCAVVDITKKLGIVTRKINEENLYQDISEMLDRTAGLSEAISFSKLINGMIEVSINHGIKLPGSFFLLGKAMLTAEGTARRFYPNLDVVKVARPLAVQYIREHLQPHFNREHFYRNSANIIKGLTAFPQDVARVIANLARGELMTIFVHRGLEPLYDKLDVVSSRLAISLIIVAMMISSALIILLDKPGYLLFGLISFIIASILGVWMVIGLIRDGRIR